MYTKKSSSRPAYERNIIVFNAIFNEGKTLDEVLEEYGLPRGPVEAALNGSNLAAVEAFIDLGLPLPENARRQAEALILFGAKMLAAVREYEERT